jgi:hypothetical protein
MTPDQVHEAMAEMQRYMREKVGPREFESLSEAENSALHDAADAHILKRYGMHGWDLAALAAASLSSQDGPDSEFGVWVQLYEDLEALGEREKLPYFFVYGDYAGDRTAVVNCAQSSEQQATHAIRSLLRSNPGYREFAVHLVPTTADGKRNASSGSTIRAEEGVL